MLCDTQYDTKNVLDSSMVEGYFRFDVGNDMITSRHGQAKSPGRLAGARWRFFTKSATVRESRAPDERVALAALILVSGAIACRTARPPVALPPSTSENVSLGEQHYLRACAKCHGATGEGGKGGPALRREVRNHDDAFLLGVMLEGHHDMPPANVTRVEAEVVAVWLRSHFAE